MTLQWWMIPCGFAVVGALLLLRPSHGRSWPFLLLIPVAAISAVFLFRGLTGGALSNFVQQDTVFQILLAARFASAILMIILADGRRIAAAFLGLAALMADPLLFNYAACAFGTTMCR